MFPGPGVTLPLFRKLDSIPQIEFPPSFLHAARGRPSGKMFIEVNVYSLLLSTVFDCVAGNDSVVVVNMVMNNIENYLPSDMVEGDVDM